VVRGHFINTPHIKLMWGVLIIRTVGMPPKLLTTLEERTLTLTRASPSPSSTKREQSKLLSLLITLQHNQARKDRGRRLQENCEENIVFDREKESIKTTERENSVDEDTKTGLLGSTR
jgi:hypothetical protein